MSYHATIRSELFTFADLCELLAKANEVKSGDQLAGLADVTLGEIVANPVIDPDGDNFYSVWPILPDETTFKLKHGYDELMDRLLTHEVSDIIDVKRSSVLARRRGTQGS
jgi:hypothetical protein